DAHGEVFKQLVSDEGVEVFPHVPELLRACHDRQLKVAVATASNENDLATMLEAAGLDLDGLADVIVTDSDVERSKPHPDVVFAASRKLHLARGQCAMVGDTPYDAQAAGRAGVAALGFMTGVHPERIMRRFGMRALFDDPAHLLDELDRAVEIASPGDGRLTQEFLEELMADVLADAEKALDSGEYPAAAVLARSDGTVLRRATETTKIADRPLRHAVADLLISASADELMYDDLVLVTTVAPCPFCYQAAVQANIDAIACAVASERSVDPEECLTSAHLRRPRVIGEVRADEGRLLLKDATEGR
ncbi:MAG: HAD hydrolase-like protein, partial [Bacteroidota bacterium]